MPLNNESHQGKFHLAAIGLIPINLIAWFIPDHWIWGIIVSGCSGLIIYFLFFRKA